MANDSVVLILLFGLVSIIDIEGSMIRHLIILNILLQNFTMKKFKGTATIFLFCYGIKLLLLYVYCSH